MILNKKVKVKSKGRKYRKKQTLHQTQYLNENLSQN